MLSTKKQKTCKGPMDAFLLSSNPSTPQVSVCANAHTFCEHFVFVPFVQHFFGFFFVCFCFHTHAHTHARTHTHITVAHARGRGTERYMGHNRKYSTYLCKKSWSEITHAKNKLAWWQRFLYLSHSHITHSKHTRTLTRVRCALAYTAYSLHFSSSPLLFPPPLILTVVLLVL